MSFQSLVRFQCIQIGAAVSNFEGVQSPKSLFSERLNELLKFGVNPDFFKPANASFLKDRTLELQNDHLNEQILTENNFSPDESAAITRGLKELIEKCDQVIRPKIVPHASGAASASAAAPQSIHDLICKLKSEENRQKFVQEREGSFYLEIKKGNPVFIVIPDDSVDLEERGKRRYLENTVILFTTIKDLPHEVSLMDEVRYIFFYDERIKIKRDLESKTSRLQYLSYHYRDALWQFQQKGNIENILNLLSSDEKGQMKDHKKILHILEPNALLIRTQDRIIKLKEEIQSLKDEMIKVVENLRALHQLAKGKRCYFSTAKSAKLHRQLSEMGPVPDFDLFYHELDMDEYAVAKGILHIQDLDSDSDEPLHVPTRSRKPHATPLLDLVRDPMLHAPEAASASASSSSLSSVFTFERPSSAVLDEVADLARV